MRTSLVLLAPGALLLAAACSSPNSGVVAGAQDTHCASVTAQPPSDYVCPSADPNGVVADPNAAADPNAPSDEGAPLYNAAGDDDDCKYHVQWSATDVRVNTDVTFMVKATWRYDSSPLTGADTYIEAVGPTACRRPIRARRPPKARGATTRSRRSASTRRGNGSSASTCTARAMTPRTRSTATPPSTSRWSDSAGAHSRWSRKKNGFG
jgi:hypothetical protein